MEIRESMQPSCFLNDPAIPFQQPWYCTSSLMTGEHVSVHWINKKTVSRFSSTSHFVLSQKLKLLFFFKACKDLMGRGNKQIQKNRTSRLSLTIITCSKFKTSKEIKNKDKKVSKKILLSNSAPPVVSEEIGGGGGGGGGKKVPVKERSGALGFLKRLPRKVLAVLSILPLAIGEMFVFVVLMAPGM
ncbi:hypothetical protein Peur_052423 [Populus x canadensis]